jgi:hypothetical protein
MVRRSCANICTVQYSAVLIVMFDSAIQCSADSNV